ncbi:MAG: hypothetical protein LBI17_00610 [Rickettsiales bacterium]|jgi:hypothetical protein|nr:hypothetical protein [Rickettsiales bacterium]
MRRIVCIFAMMLVASSAYGQRGGTRKTAKTAAPAAATETAFAAPTETQCREDIDYCFSRYCFDKKTVENGSYSKCGSMGAAQVTMGVEEECLKIRAAVKQLDLVAGCKKWTFDMVVKLLENKGAVEKQLKINSPFCQSAASALAAAKKCHAGMLAHDGSIDPALKGRLESLCGAGAGGDDTMVERFLRAGDYGDANAGAQRDMLLTSQNTAKRDNWRQAVDMVLAGYIDMVEIPCGSEDYKLAMVNDYQLDSRDNLQMAQAKATAERIGRNVADRITGEWFEESDCLKKTLPDGGAYWIYEEEGDDGRPGCRVQCDAEYKAVGDDACEKKNDVSMAFGGAFVGVNNGVGFDNRISDPVSSPAVSSGIGGYGGGSDSGGGIGVGAMVSGAAYSTGGTYKITIDPNWKDEHSVAYIGVQRGANVYVPPTPATAPASAPPAAPGNQPVGGGAGGCGKAYANSNASAQKTCAAVQCTQQEICAMVFGSPPNYTRHVSGNSEGIACFGSSSTTRDLWYAVPGGGGFHEELTKIFSSYTDSTVDKATIYLKAECEKLAPPPSTDNADELSNICAWDTISTDEQAMNFYNYIGAHSEELHTKYGCYLIQSSVGSYFGYAYGQIKVENDPRMKKQLILTAFRELKNKVCPNIGKECSPDAGGGNICNIIISHHRVADYKVFLDFLGSKTTFKSKNGRSTCDNLSEGNMYYLQKAAAKGSAYTESGIGMIQESQLDKALNGIQLCYCTGSAPTIVASDDVCNDVTASTNVANYDYDKLLQLKNFIDNYTSNQCSNKKPTGTLYLQDRMKGAQGTAITGISMLLAGKDRDPYYFSEFLKCVCIPGYKK